jgi:hypothetical protein
MNEPNAKRAKGSANSGEGGGSDSFAGAGGGGGAEAARPAPARPASPRVLPSLLHSTGAAATVDRGALATLRAAYRAAMPTPHVRMPGPFLADDALLQRARNELRGFDFAPQSSDCAEHFVTPSLLGISAHETPALAQLRDALVDPTTLRLIGGVAGAFDDGGSGDGGGGMRVVELDAVIFPRKGYLLAAPEQPPRGSAAPRELAFWLGLGLNGGDEAREEGEIEGGCLEFLEPLDNDEAEKSTAARMMRPKWNSLTVFDAGVPFAVRELFEPSDGAYVWLRGIIRAGGEGEEEQAEEQAEEVEREEEDEDEHEKQGKGKGKAVRAPAPVHVPLVRGTDGDEELLRRWVRPKWLSESGVAHAHAFFAALASGEGAADAVSHITLADWLVEDQYKLLRQAVADEGSGQWEQAGPAHRQLFLRQAADGAGDIVKEYLGLMQSACFGELVGRLIDVPVLGMRAVPAARRFGQGCYTLLPPLDAATEEEEFLQLHLCLSDNPFATNVDADAGGHLVYAGPGDMGEEECEYCRVYSQPNSLCIALIQPCAFNSYVKFVNASAEMPRLDICADYVLEAEPDEEESGSSSDGEMSS